MVSPADHQLGVRQSCIHYLERLDHQLKPFIRSPFSERQYAVLWIAATGEIRILRPARKNTMGPHMNVVVTILLVEYLPIPRHKHRNRIREQQHPGGDSTSRAVDARVANPCIFQIDGIHQMVQRHVCITAAQPG
ncbi:MAG: hypothetical protein ACYDDS_17885 [Candidatus Sulfotelmatobacter sp.]